MDRVAAAGAVVAAAGCALPFMIHRANRIVTGDPIALLRAGLPAWVLMAIIGVTLVVAVIPRREAIRGAALRALAAVMVVSIAWATSSASSALVGGSEGPARVSLGPGAWVVLTGAAMVWFAGMRGCVGGVRRWGTVAAAALVIAGMLAAGAFRDLGLASEYAAQRETFWAAVGAHAGTVGISLLFALAIGLPLGAAAARWRLVRSMALGVTGVLQTVPSLALLGLLVIPLTLLGLPGLGTLPAVIALTLYALLPIVRNTYVGLSGVDPAVVDAGRGMGMRPAQLLLRVEAPLALPVIIEGVRSAAVMIVGIAAVTAFVGTKTLGVLVFMGWGQQADDLILLGAVPMVLMAIAADGVLRAAGRRLTSPGLREEAACSGSSR